MIFYAQTLAGVESPDTTPQSMTLSVRFISLADKPVQEEACFCALGVQVISRDDVGSRQHMLSYNIENTARTFVFGSLIDSVDFLCSPSKIGCISRDDIKNRIAHDGLSLNSPHNPSRRCSSIVLYHLEP